MLSLRQSAFLFLALLFAAAAVSHGIILYLHFSGLFASPWYWQAFLLTPSALLLLIAGLIVRDHVIGRW